MTDDQEYRPRHLAPDDVAPDDVASDVDAPAPAARRRPERVSRFIARHGWRALALPVLTGLAVLALVVAVANPPQPAGGEIATAGFGGATAAPSDSSAPSSATTEGEPGATDTPAAPTSSFVQAGDSSLNVVPGQSAVLGTGGPVLTFDVEVEGGIGVDGAQFAAEVEQILGDPRSWGAGGQMSFQRVSSGDVDFHVALVSPDHVEGLCPGYNTNGFTSCRYGDRAVINLARWSIGVTDYEGYLEDYRQYVVNHEVGHYLGHTHVECPAPGAKAPVMMQQTLGVLPCAINAWPYPNGPADNPTAPA
ncbi:DUF3152 domain-containing protein [Blastococcus sp. Marseille-P5729]|uniref:DUF3152 domain-containing protein n=1 Tax=Blastococcus sp. Marseille-P5729 TaxID=2086582 RepID=UPI000D0FC1F8|nr:DUF3152 domain-containing protein [Blastococcus sp. Marseille-P5729]